MHNNKIDWSKLKKERIVYETISSVKHLGDDIYSCPLCDGSGRAVEVHRTFPPHKYDKCGVCDGTGEIIKCIHSGCNNPVANNQTKYPSELCYEHERIDKIYKKAIEQLEKDKQR